MPTKKPAAKQLAARKKFTEMVRNKATASKKTATKASKKKAATKKPAKRKTAPKASNKAVRKSNGVRRRGEERKVALVLHHDGFRLPHGYAVVKVAKKKAAKKK